MFYLESFNYVTATTPLPFIANLNGTFPESSPLGQGIFFQVCVCVFDKLKLENDDAEMPSYYMYILTKQKDKNSKSIKQN